MCTSRLAEGGGAAVHHTHPAAATFSSRCMNRLLLLIFSGVAYKNLMRSL